MVPTLFVRINVAVKSKYAKEIGRKTFQPNAINWSYRYLGSAARAQTNKMTKKQILLANQNEPGRKVKK